MTRKDINNRMQEKPNDLGLKYGNQKYNEKVDNQHDKKIRRIDESQKVEIHIDLLKPTLKISKWKTPDHDGIHGFWF